MITGYHWKKLNCPIIFQRISKNSKKVVLEIEHGKIGLVQVSVNTWNAACLPSKVGLKNLTYITKQ